MDLGADCAAPRVRAGGRPKKAILPRAESADAAIGAARAGDGGVSGGGDPNLPPGTTARVLTSAVGSETAVRRFVGGEREGVAGLGSGAEAGDRLPLPTPAGGGSSGGRAVWRAGWRGGSAGAPRPTGTNVAAQRGQAGEYAAVDSENQNPL